MNSFLLSETRWPNQITALPSFVRCTPSKLQNFIFCASSLLPPFNRREATVISIHPCASREMPALVYLHSLFRQLPNLACLSVVFLSATCYGSERKISKKCRFSLARLFLSELDPLSLLKFLKPFLPCLLAGHSFLVISSVEKRFSLSFRKQPSVYKYSHLNGPIKQENISLKGLIQIRYYRVMPLINSD